MRITRTGCSRGGGEKQSLPKQEPTELAEHMVRFVREREEPRTSPGLLASETGMIEWTPLCGYLKNATSWFQK